MSLCVDTDEELAHAARLLGKGQSFYMIVPGTQRKLDVALGRLQGPDSPFPGDRTVSFNSGNTDSTIRILRRPAVIKTFEVVKGVFDAVELDNAKRKVIKVSACC